MRLISLSVVLLAACSRPAPSLTVLAASSLAESFRELESGFEAGRDVEVRLVFAGSQTLAMQLRQGMQADVFASADVLLVEALAGEGLAGPPRAFARGTIVIAGQEPPSLRKLPEARRLVIGAPDVPIGRYTAQLFEAAEAVYGAEWRRAVDGRVASRELAVRQVRAKLLLGEADAGILYATDVVPPLVARAVPTELAPSPRYVQSVVAGAASPHAEAWLDYVGSDAGRAVLTEHGFLLAAEP